jgi:hypothetical protein
MRDFLFFFAGALAGGLITAAFIAAYNLTKLS